MSRLLEMPDTSSPLGRRDRAILELFYASGLRLSELVGLGLEDVNLSSRVVRVLGKGGKERIVPFNRSTEAAIRAWLHDARPFMRLRLPSALAILGKRLVKSRLHVEPLFLNYQGGRLSTRSVDRWCASTWPHAAPASGSARTRSVTRSPRTCSNEAPISG